MLVNGINENCLISHFCTFKKIVLKKNELKLVWKELIKICILILNYFLLPVLKSIIKQY